MTIFWSIKSFWRQKQLSYRWSVQVIVRGKPKNIVYGWLHTMKGIRTIHQFLRIWAEFQDHWWLVVQETGNRKFGSLCRQAPPRKILQQPLWTCSWMSTTGPCTASLKEISKVLLPNSEALLKVYQNLPFCNPVYCSHFPHNLTVLRHLLSHSLAKEKK